MVVPRRFSRLWPLVSLAVANSAWSQDAVVVESASFPAGTPAAVVGIYIENSVPLGAIILPLEFRSVTPGSYPGSSIMTADAGRVAASGLSDLFLVASYSDPNAVNSCSGPVSRTYSMFPGFDFESPDAKLINSVVKAGVCMAAGADPAGVPSYTLTFDVGCVLGEFEIDTCCVSPGSKFNFVDCGGTKFLPEFTKGTVTIMPACPCHADPACDGVGPDILDVVKIIACAFRGVAGTGAPPCSTVNEDVNCSGFVDVIDVVTAINVAFRGADPEVSFCDPCG